MALPNQMYSAKNNSPITKLTATLNSSETVMSVEDASVFPDAPNLAVIGNSIDAEIVLIVEKNDNNLTIRRGINGTVPGVWNAGTDVSRNFTSYDHDSFKANIEYLDSGKSDTNHTHDDRYYTESETNNLLAAKAPLASPTFTGTPKAPTADSDTNTTQIATTAFVTSHDDFTITGEVSSGNYILTDSRIDNSHWQVDWILFGTPSNVDSKITWTTKPSSNSLTLKATYSGSTNVTVNMHWVQ